MIKHKNWWPTKQVDQKENVRILGENVGDFSEDLPLTPTEVTKVQSLCAQFIAAMDYTSNSQARMKGLNGWKDAVLYSGTPGGEAQKCPTFQNPPELEFTEGLFAQIAKVREEIMLKPGYTQAIGEDLMLVGPTENRTPIEDMQPMMTVKATSGYLVDVKGKIDGMDGFIVEYATGADEYRVVAYLSTSPGVVHIDPKVANTAEKGRIRVRYMRKNQAVGQYSPTYPITIF